MPHQNFSRRSLIAAGGLAAGALATAGIAARAATTQTAAAQVDPPATAPDTALARLVAGNERFYQGKATHPDQSVAHLPQLANGQHPFAIILGCADSRVAPEILFDQGLGDLFDNRVAGNIVDDLSLGSVEYAVEELASPLIMVLGHERCGAVTATVEAIEHGGALPGRIGAIVEALRPIVEPLVGQSGDVVDAGVSVNVRAQVRALLTSEIIGEKVRQGELAVVGARYDLDTGAVVLLD